MIGDEKRVIANKSCTDTTRKRCSCPIAHVEKCNRKSALLKVRIIREIGL